MQASTHCHQWPSIPPCTRGYFSGTWTSLLRDSGSSRGWLPPHPQETFPFVPMKRVAPSKSFSPGQSPSTSLEFWLGSTSVRRSGVIPPSSQNRSTSLPFFRVNLNFRELETGPLSGYTPSLKIPLYTVLALPEISVG